MRVISQVDSAEYYENQAIIEIHEAMTIRQSGMGNGYTIRMIKAIQLIVLAICQND